MRSTLRHRQIHLDFHDPETFARTLKQGNVDSVTVFARGHHGWSYYPTAVGTPHPNLARPDLLGEIVQDGRTVHFSHPVFRAYATSGQPLYRDMVKSALETLLEKPQLRGRGHRMTSGSRIDVEVIEDPVPLHDVPCSVAVDRKPESVRLQVSIHELVVIQL